GSIGGLLIFILNDVKRNPLVNVGAGLWDSYNMATGLLGDVLSYIRLFALGISGAVMGFVFNDLAIQLSGDIPVVSHIIMIIIMLIGHGINIFMSGLSAFVHPMRLTFVEFYKNSGFEGGGKKYSPFAKYKEKESLF
ncbi:MAG: ATPase, partial [Paludibacter sp.]|nr:ATPase [Paludibacter sp.]